MFQNHKRVKSYNTGSSTPSTTFKDLIASKNQEFEDLDETLGEVYRSSYFNPSTYKAKFETLNSTIAKPSKLPPEKVAANKAIIESMEKRISKYLNKQKRDEKYGAKTLRNFMPNPRKELPVM